MKSANFKVDPRLATLLGEAYRSSEQAIKELVDNAWDAEAEHVDITLPAAMTADPIVVNDDGSGMTEQELRRDYLLIARDRRASKGDRTPNKNRLVKGRRGIGKFAGLTVADIMHIETCTGGRITRLTIPRDELTSAPSDLERFAMPIEVEECAREKHGTTVTLSRLHQNLSFPDAERLKQLLVLEYGRAITFTVRVNGVPLDLTDVRGEAFTEETTLPEAGSVRLRFKITDEQQPTKRSGIVMRIGGKIVGKPSHFGLDSMDDLPRPLLRRVYGEVEVDSLADDVTADWGAIIENSKGFAEVEQWIQGAVRKQLDKTFHREINLAKARLQQEINRRLAKLPEHRREIAGAAMERLMSKFYEESEERIKPIVSVMLDALERDEYWIVLQQIEHARHGDVQVLAEALSTFGLLEIALVGQHAHRRLQFLDSLEELLASPESLERTMHTALENNLWVFGSDFSLVTSNRTLANIISRYTDEKFTGPRAATRPDLLLVSEQRQHYTLIEFKRPSHTLTRDDISQVEKYRDDLLSQLPAIDIVVIGKDYDTRIAQNRPTGLTVASYGHLISSARTELSWLIRELSS